MRGDIGTCLSKGPAALTSIFRPRPAETIYWRGAALKVASIRTRA
jgi:hypothetical protein